MLVSCKWCSKQAVVGDAWTGVNLELIQGWSAFHLVKILICGNCKKMIKVDEITFLIVMQLRCRVTGQPGGEAPRAIIASMSHLLAEKRALYLLDKWAGKGWYDYGTVIDGGWLTAEGKAASYESQWQQQHPVLNS